MDPWSISFTPKLASRSRTATRIVGRSRFEHLDLHEITTDRRVVTQTIAADLFDRGVAAVRFPSRLDGDACIALLERRGNVVALTA